VSFVVRAGGQPVTPDPYLGAAGHLVALRTSDLAYLHAHPVGGGATADFAVAFPGPGTYRLFFQFSAGGAVHTAAFTYEVAS
jgi:hypothetical protein